MSSLWLLSYEQTITQEEKKILDRELARAKVSANRMATTVANEWKDKGDKLMPVKQWMEERKFLQVLLEFIQIFSLFLLNTRVTINFKP